MTEQVPQQTPDIQSAARGRLEEAFPGAVVDGTIAWQRLQLELGDLEAVAPTTRYLFSWAGKRDSAGLMQIPCRGTLAPVADASVNWAETSNLFIEGENLEVLKLLYRPYFGQIRLIYVDPPYNLAGDPLYADDYTDPLGHYLALTGAGMNEGPDAVRPVGISGTHSSWLSMLYPRLILARQLLRDDGFIAVSVDDSELHHLRLVLNETFGEENYLATLVWDRNRKNDAKFFSVGHEYMVVYARKLQWLRDSKVVLRAPKEGVDEIRLLWEQLRSTHGDDFTAIQASLRAHVDQFPDDDHRRPLARFRKVDARGPYRDDVDISWPGGGGPTYDVLHPQTGKVCRLPRRGWVYPTLDRMNEEIAKDNVAFGSDETTVPALKSYLFEKTVQVMRSVQFSYAQTSAQEFDSIFDGLRVFDNPKHFDDLRRIVDYLTEDDDIILDFFAGSASLGHGVLASNLRNRSRRRFILVQWPEPVRATTPAGRNARSIGLSTISAIGMERLRRVIAPMEILTADASGDGVPQNLGFRVFRLAGSKLWALARHRRQ